MLKHLQKLLLIGAMLCVPWVTQAQSLEEYQVTVDTTTFTSIASTGTALSFSTTDDGYATVTLPFAMPYGASTLAANSTITCSANGFICLDTTATSGTTGAYSNAIYRVVNALMQQDAHIGRYAESGAYWSYDGTSSVRSLTIEYHGLGTYSEPYGFYSYQVVFYEDGNIEFIYDSMYTANTTRTFATYLTDGPHNDRLFLTGAWATPTVSNAYATRPNTPIPAHGLRYTFSRPTITCPRPTMVAITDITANGATISWTHGGTETEWVLRCGEDVYYPADTFYTVSNLNSNTQYNVVVRAICGSGDTSTNRMGSFRTACGTILSTDLPFVEDFESYAATSTTTIPCWTKGTSSTTAYPYPTSTVVNGTRCLYFYGYYPSSATTTRVYSWAALPPIDESLDMSDLMLTFLVKRGSTSSNYYNTLLYIGIADSVTGFTTSTAIEGAVTWIDTISHFSDPANSIHSEEVSFADYAGTGKYVVIYCPVPPLQGSATYAYNYAYVDDVTLRAIPTCFWPAEVELTSVAPNDAVVSWTPDTRTPSPAAWNVEYGVHGFTLGQGTTATVTSTSITLSNLLANTQYDIYVSADCGNGDVSDPASFTFRTECAYIDELPFAEGFETATTGSTTSTSFVNCWHRLNNGTQYFGYPYVSTTTNYVHSGTKGLYWYHTTTTGTYGDYQVVVLPGIDPTAYDMTDLTLSFYAKTTGASYHPTPIVGVMTNPNDLTTFTPVYTFTSTEITTDWNLFTVQFANYTGNGNYIAIKWNRPSSTSYMCIDDIYLTDEWCYPPADVVVSPTTDEITVSWNSNGGSSFEVYLGSDTLYSVTDTFYTFTNLTPNTLYNYGVATECSNSNSIYINGSVRTLCTLLDSLPYSYGFEGLSTTSSTAHPVIPCWQHLNNGTQYFGYPYITSTAHTGTRSLYWFASTTTGTYGDYQIVVLPGVDANYYPVNTLQLTFWAKASSSSYHPIYQVGVMTDPTDANTFQVVGTVDVGAGNTTWTEYTVPLNNYNGNGQYVAVRALRPSSSWYGYTDDFTLEQMPSCPPVLDLTAESVTAGAALLTWDYQRGTEDVPSGFNIVVVDSSNTPTSYITTDQHYLLTGLDANAPYTVYVSTDCNGVNGGSDSVSFSTTGLPCLVADPTTSFSDTLVYGTATSSYIPSYSFYNYSLTQQIFTAAEIGHGGTISSISFMPSAYSVPRVFEVYLGHVNVATSTSYLYPSDLTLVYNSVTTVSMTANQWNTLQFSTPFDYNGSDNLLIMVRDMTGDYTSGNTWKGVESTSGVSRYAYQDSGPYAIGYSGGNTGSFRSNTIIAGIGCSVEATCANPAISVTRTDPTEVDLVWVPGYQESSWDLDYRVAGASTWNSLLIGTSLTEYTVTNLNPATEYEFRVSHTCDTTTYSASVTQLTPCTAMPVPFDYGFEDFPASGASTGMPACWTRFSTYGTAYPYSSTSYAHSGSKSLYHYSTSSSYTYLVLPMMEPSVDSLMISFWMYKANTSYTHAVEVGVMTDPNDISTFTSLATVQCANLSTWELMDVNLNNYTGNGRYIALLSPNNVYSYPYIDDIHVDYIPTCPHVTNLHATATTEDSIHLVWTAGGNEQTWLVSDGINEYEVNTNSYGFSGLVPNQQYTFTVRPVCTSEDTGYAMSVSVRTACPAYMTLPYSENFDDLTTSTSAATGVSVPCWNYIMTNSSYASSSYVPQLYYSTSANYHHSGLYALRLYGLSYTALPQSPIGVDSLSMSFWSMHTSTDYNLIVGVMSDPTDQTTFDTVLIVPYTGTSVMQYFEIDFSNYTGTGRYIAFRNWHPSYGYSYHYIDDIEVWRNSTCPAPAYATVSDISNDQATVSWSDTSNSWAGAMIYLSRYNNIALAEDSAFVSGASSYTFTGLTGNTTYYVWVMGSCTDEPSRSIMEQFTTTPDCVPVENLSVAGTDYYAFGLNWDAPTAGHPVTGYIVSWRESGTTAWTSDTTNNTYYYVSGLTISTPYQYKVTSICDTIVSAANSGSVSTRGCGTLVTEGGTNYAYLPTQQFYSYSYTQQLYYASELAGIDTIANISFHVEDDYACDTRNIVIYLGNTAKTNFASTGDYIPAANLTQVYSGTMSGSGWINLHLNTNFERNADSNLVVVMDDNTGSYTSTIYWTSTSTSAVRSLYFYQDGTDILPASPSASSSGSVAYVNQILLSGPNCETPQCGEPIIFATATGETQIDITWNAEPNHTYQVAYRLEGTSNWTVFDANNTTGTCSITGLTPSANWNVRVLFDCNGDTLIGTRTIPTACGAAALPLTEDFQNREFGIYERNCWTIGTTNLGTTYPYPRVTTLQGAPDNKLCLFYNGGYMILPRVAAPLNQLQIRFKLTQGGDNVRFLMGTITDPTLPINAMHVLDTLIRSDIDTSTSTVNITYSFVNLPEADTAAYICFWDAFNDNYSFLDDIVVEYIPICTPATAFTVAATDSSAVITWDNDGENGTSYIIEYGPRYFTLGTGTQITSTGSPVTINGLTHSTSYDVYVYTVCGATGDTSIESQVVMFQTDCAPYTTLPYFTDFENIMSPGSTATDVVPNCWAAESSVGTMPHVYYTSTSNYTSSPTHCFYFYSNGVAALPEMGVPLDTLMISFYDYNTAPSGYGLIIGTVDSITPGFEASFQPIDTVVYEPGSSNGYHVVSYLTDYTGTATRLAIKNYNTNSSLTYSYHYIDDLTVDFVPACIAPQHVHTTLLLDNQADLAWTVSNASSYTVEYGVHGFTPGTGTVLTTTTRDISITGLTAQTQYDVYLVSGCGSDTTFYTFTTTCAAVTLPWSENFDSYTTSTSSATGVYVPCWGYTTTGTASYGTGSYLPQVYYSSTYAQSGSYSYRLYGAGYHTLPPMPTSLDSLQLTFWDYTTSEYYGLEVGVMEGNTFVPVQVINTPASSHAEYEVYFSNYTGTSRTIAFRNYYTTSSTTYYSYHYIDNISVDYIPTCPHVSNITSVGATVNSINVDWHDRVAASQWEIEYGVHGFTQGAGTSVTVTQHPATITGLDSATYYDVYVRPICSATDMGPWEMATLMSGICDGMLEFYTGNSTGTGYNAPVNNLWKYTLSEVIIDSAELYDAGFRAGTQIGKIAYSYNYATAMTDKTNVDIWIQPTTKTVFANTSDIVALNPTTAIQAYHGDLNCSQGWNYFECQDTLPITWDGHSNLMVIVDDNSNDYNSSTYIFHTTNCTGYKTITFYSDSYNPDVTSQTALASYSGSKTYYQYRPTMKLVSCGNAMCSAPNLLTPSNVDYQSATLNWSGNATDYEVAVKAATDPAYPAATAVSATTYTVNGLQPATTYLYHVRAMCDTTEGLISDWAEGTFTTDSLPCFAPTELHVVDSAYTTVTLGWTIGTSETSWNIHVWNTNFDTNYTVNTNPATVGGLATNMSFNAAVSALCGGGMVESEFGDTISFMTAMCAVPTGLTATNITTNSATITWNGTASSYELQYGEHGFPEGQGTVVTVNGNSYNLTGLDSETEYDVAVSAVCDAGNGVQSTYTARYSFETAEEIGIADVNGLNVNIYPNPASNSTNITLSGVTGEVTIAIIDMNGRTVRSSTMSCDGDCATTIEVSDLASGAYFVRISGEEVNTVKKLVVK